MSKVPLRGVYAAALTPLNDDLSPDLKSLVRHYKWLLANGCDGLAPLGTTGEANSFSVDERLSVIDALGGSGIGRGGPSLRAASRAGSGRKRAGAPGDDGVRRRWRDCGG